MQLWAQKKSLLCIADCPRTISWRATATGTPIFSVNASSGGNPNLKTTAQAFGGEPNEKGEKVLPLHTYTIVNAINDGNVLPFRIDYINTIKKKETAKDKQVILKFRKSWV